jgi:hypothetical protein
MSQPGMMAHWKREAGPSSRRNMIVNLLGAITAGATVLIVIAAKFSEGAWITLLAIPSLIALMYGVHRHHSKIQHEIETKTPLDTDHQPPPILVVTMQGWTRVNQQALRAAMMLSPDIKVVHVTEEDQPNDFCDRWKEYVQQPAARAHLPVPELVRLSSPYRLVVTLIVQYVNQLAAENADRRIITVIPELMERRWFHWLLHTQRATILKTRILMECSDRVSVLNIPWHLKSA